MFQYARRRTEGRRKEKEKLKVFCIVKFLLVPFSPVLSGVTLNGMSGNDARSELRDVLTKKMKEEGAALKPTGNG